MRGDAMTLHHAETWEACHAMSTEERAWLMPRYWACYHREADADESYARDEHAAGAFALVASYAKRRGE